MTFWSAIGAWMTRRARSRSETRDRSLIELSNDFFWETDAEHRYTAIELGPAYRGVRNNESKLGFARWDIPYASPDPSAWAAHRATIAARERFIDFRFSRIENGEERFYEHSGEPRYDARGKFLGYRGVGRDVTERLRAEEALRQSEGRYMRAVAAAEAGFWDWDVVQDKYYVSPRLLEMAGLPRDTIIAGREDFQARVPLHPEDLARWQQEIQALFASGGSRLSTELRVIVGGQTRWYRLDGMCFRDAAGRVVRWTGSSIDVTERKRVEEALRVSEERYARVMQAIEDGFWEWVVATDEFYASPRMLALYGLPPDTVFRGRADFLAQFPFHPEDMKSWREAVAAHLAGKTARVDIEVRAKVRAQMRWIRVTAICQRDASGAEERWTGSVSDVTAPRAAQEALGRSEERYARAMEGSDAGHWDWNIVTDEMFVSERAREMLALPAGSLPGRRAEMMDLVPMHPEDRAAMGDVVKDGLRKGIHERDYRVIPRPGEVRWLRSRGKVYKDAQGAAVRMTGSLIDITERALAADALRASEHRYSLAMDASEEAHYDLDVGTGELFTSERLNEIYGFAPGTRFAHRSDYLAQLRLHDDDAARYHAALDAAVAKDGPERYEFEFRIVHPSGEVRWLRTRGKVIRDAEGHARRRVGVVADITAAKLADQALHESEQRYERAMSAAEAGFWDWDVAKDEFYVSPRLLRMGGFAPGTTFAGRADFMRRTPFHPEDRDSWQQAVKALFAGGGSRLAQELRVIIAGETRWYRLDGMCFRNAAGQVVRWTGSSIDVTDRRLAEEALRASEERYARAMEATEAGHWEWDLVTHQVFHSPRFRELYGIRPDETFADRDAWKARQPVSASERERQERALQAAIADPSKTYDIELSFEIRPGEVRWLRSRAKVFRAEDGRPLRVTGATTDITPQKLAQEALRESQERYALAVAGSDDGVWDCDFAARRVFLSARGRELAGMPPGPDTVPMEAFFAGLLLHPDDVERRSAAFQAHLAGETPAYVGEFRLRQPDGVYRWRRLRGLCVRDANGRPQRMAGSISDIDARKRAEDSRRMSEERYALAMEAAGDGHTDWNLETGEFYISPRLLEILGYAPDTTFADRADWVRRFPFHPEDRPKWEAAIAEHFAGREAKFRMDLRIVVKGETRWVAFTFIATRDASGKPVRWTGSIADINDAKLTEEARRLSEERYELAMRASGAGHWDWKIASDEFYASPRYLEFGGFPPDTKYSGRADIVSRIPFHPDDKAQYEAAVAAHFAGQTPSVDMVIRVVPHGETRWLHVIGTCLRDAQGKPTRWAGSVTDISARKLAEEALRLSEKRYALAMEVADEGHFDWNVQTDEIFASARALAVIGASPEAKYRTRSDIVAHVRYHPEDDERIRKEWRAALDGRGVDHEFEYRILRGEAQEARWLRGRWKVFRDEAGVALRVIGVIADITERKLAADELRQSEARFRALTGISSDWYWRQDENLRFTYLSEGVSERAGWAGDVYIGRLRWEVPDIHLISCTWDEHKEVLAKRQPFRDLEYWRLGKDGRVVYSSISGAPIYDGQGNFKGYQGTGRNITERKRMEEELRQSEARFRSLTELSSDWYWEQDQNLRFTYLSSQVGELTGFSGESSLGKARWEIDNMTPLTCSWAEHRSLLEAREPFRDFECRRVGPDGTVRYLSMSGAPIFDAQGRFTGYRGIGRNITARKLADEAVRESEARFRSLVELSSDWYWRQDENLRFVSYVPPDVGSRSGVSAASSLGKARWDFDDVTPLSSTWEEHKALLAARQPFRDFEYVRLDDNGTPHYTVISGVPLFDSQGRFTGYHGVGRNVSERRRFEAELRSRQEMLDLAQKSARAVAFEWSIRDDGLHRNRWSDELAAMYGLAPGDRDGSFERWKKLIHPEDWPAVKAAIKHALRTGDVDTEYRVVHPDGAVHWLEAKGRMFFDAERKPSRMLGFLHDVSERKRVEEALRQSEERYALAVEGSNEGIFDWDLASDRVYVSHRAQELFGLSRGELWRPRRDWRHILSFHPDDAPRLHDAIKAHIEGGSPTYDVEFRIIVADGDVRWFRQRGIALRDASGKAYRVVGSIGDVTEKHLTEEELRKLERKLRLAQRLEAMGTLAGGIAHDFNNILGAILGYGEMAQRDAPKGSRLARDLDSIIVAGERGRALVDRVLAFSRSSVGERVPVHVEKVVREALDLVSAKLPPDVTLHAKLHAGRAAMLGDATQVHQVLMNLASNAIQAMPSGGTLRVSLRPMRLESARAPTIGILDPGEYLVLEVADTGTGIAPEILDRIFDPFFTTKEVGTGTGLGLSLVHGIVSEVGGAIDVVSKAGAGSTFTVFLPRSGHADGPSQREESVLPRGDGQRVLIVDDEEPLVKLAARTLEELGYVPVGFTSSTAALAAFRAEPHRFQAVITDERMPGLSGSALIREVRGINGRIPIVLMSGYIGGTVASGAREAGAEEVLKKPLSARDLATSLARVLHA